MKFTCPQCGAAGSIADRLVPEEGRFLLCPHCNCGFDLKKQDSVPDRYKVDVCPSCGYNTFGEEGFSTCPQCRVSVLTALQQSRDERSAVQERGTAARRVSAGRREQSTEGRPLFSAGFLQNVDPVSLISRSCTVASVIVTGSALYALAAYHTGDIRVALIEQRGENISPWYVFFRYALLSWVQLLYGVTALTASVLFSRHLEQGRRMLMWLLRGAACYVPVSMAVKYLRWWLVPIPHSWGGYIIELLNALMVSTLIGLPLYVLSRLLEDRKITRLMTASTGEPRT